MTKIGLLSDSHGHIPASVKDYLADCDEIWHAGDVGTIEVIEELQSWGKTLKGVYGNIDGQKIRSIFPEYLNFDVEGTKVLMIHIGGYPGRYSPRSQQLIKDLQPDVFVCGHSHILRVEKDPKKGMVCINPGAVGKHGFHKVSTCLRFHIENGSIKGMEVIELGTRGI